MQSNAENAKLAVIPLSAITAQLRHRGTCALWKELYMSM